MTTPDDGAIELTWQPEEADYREGFRSVGMRRSRQVVLVTVPTVVLAGLGIGLAKTSLIAFAITWLLVWLYVLGPLRRVSSRGLIRRAASLQGRWVARLVPGEGMRLTMPGFATMYAWSVFDRVQESDQLFILRTTAFGVPQYYFLAKRGLGPGTDVSAMRELLKREIPSAPRSDATRR